MSVNTFIPKIWSASLLDVLRKTLVYGNLVNRNYEGEISQAGDSVVINQLGDVTISDYTRNEDIPDFELLDTTDMTLIIDQMKTFHFGIDDVDRRQALGGLVEQATESAAYGLADTVDQYLGNLLAEGTIVDGLGTDADPLMLTSANAYEAIVAMNVKMNKANIPKIGRWLVAPPEFEGLMLEDSRFVNGGVEASENRLVNGEVYRASGFNIMISNNVPTDNQGQFKVIASNNTSCTYAEQILKMVAYSPEKKFADAIKGLHVYGGKLVRPERVAVATVEFSANTSGLFSGYSLTGSDLDTDLEK